MAILVIIPAARTNSINFLFMKGRDVDDANDADSGRYASQASRLQRDYIRTEQATAGAVRTRFFFHFFSLFLFVPTPPPPLPRSQSSTQQLGRVLPYYELLLYIPDLIRRTNQTTETDSVCSASTAGRT